MINIINSLPRESIILILQGCDCEELLSLYDVNQYFKQLIKNESRVWSNARLDYDSSTMLDNCIESTYGFELNEYFQRRPMLKHVGRVKWTYNKSDQAMEIRDLIQLLPHVTWFQIQSDLTFDCNVWPSFFNPSVNNFHLTLHTLIVERCNIPTKMWNQITFQH
jgi:hypothetical protein